METKKTDTTVTTLHSPEAAAAAAPGQIRKSSSNDTLDTAGVVASGAYCVVAVLKQIVVFRTFQ